MFGPTYSGYAQPYYGHERPLSWVEVFALFGRPASEIRFLGAADSLDDLAVVTWIVERNRQA